MKMETFFITFIVFFIAVSGMAVGLLAKKHLKGSCGGLNAFLGQDKCEFCEKPVEDCPNKEKFSVNN